MTGGTLAGRVAIVTGGSSGIGRAIAVLFAREGARVVVAARGREAGDEVVRTIVDDGGDARFVATDVAEPAQVEALVAAAEEAFGAVHVLVSSAGILANASAPDTSIELWRRILDTDLGGAFYLAKYGIPALRRSGGGSIVMVASELGLVGARETVAYCAAKGGLVNMVRALAVDHAGEGIRVNALCPGPIDTPMLRAFFADAPDPEELERRQLDPIPLGRWGTPEDIARAALFLASDASAFMVGATLVADGGATATYGL